MKLWANEDINKCNRLAQASPEGMRSAAMMAVMSIQQSWNLVPAAMEDVKDRGARSRFLWGFKQDTYQYLYRKPKRLEHLFVTTMTTRDPVELLDLWTTVPGLGLAKAGFVVQLIKGKVGCIDRHNALAYDVSANALSFPKGRMTVKAQRHKLEAYVHLTDTIGGSRYLWEQWCIMVAAKYPHQFTSPQAVSSQHVNILEYMS
jgi:hypothetical protein